MGVKEIFIIIIILIIFFYSLSFGTPTNSFCVLENIEVMKSIRGASRGENINFDRDKMKTFENAEVKSYSYKKIPRRLLATIDIEGDPTTEKIGEKVKELKKGTPSSLTYVGCCYLPFPYIYHFLHLYIYLYLYVNIIRYIF